MKAEVVAKCLDSIAVKGEDGVGDSLGFCIQIEGKEFSVVVTQHQQGGITGRHAILAFEFAASFMAQAAGVDLPFGARKASVTNPEGALN